MKVTLDFNETGLGIFFQKWEIELLHYLLREKETDSMKAHKEVAHLISRSSVINFLNRLNKLGICTKKGVSTRGGWKGVYILLSPLQTDYKIYDYLVKTVDGLFVLGRIEQ